MTEPQRIEDVIIRSIKNLEEPALKNLDWANYKQIPLAGKLDSLSMVNLIMAIEEELKNEFGRDISLFNGKINSQTQGQLFATVGTLLIHIEKILSKSDLK